MTKVLRSVFCFFLLLSPVLAFAAAPSTQASSIVLTNVGATSAIIGWTSGNGLARAVFIKAITTSTFQIPSTNTTYSANNTTFTSGAQIGATGWYCIYNGNGSTVSISGLTANTSYTVEVAEYNGTAGTEAYTSVGAVQDPVVFATNSFLAWDFNGAPGNQASNTPTSVAANLNSTVTVTRGAPTGTPSGSTFTAVSFTAGGDSTDAVANNKYLQFTVNASSAYNVSLSAIDANFRKSASGPSSFIWKYSLDNFATTGVTIGNAFTWSVGVASSGAAQTQVPLSSITALQNVASGKTITFRLYCWAASSTGGTFGFGALAGNDLTVGGTVTASTAPVNTALYPKVSNPLSFSLDLTSNLNIPGKTYYVAIPTTGGTAPTTVAQVLAGQDGNNNPVTASGSFVVRYTSTDATKTITGLTSSTAYTIYTVSQDQSITPINQAAISSATGTTAAGASSNADLSGLALSGGFSISPTFAAATTAYTVTVPNGTASITVTPTVADATATVKVNTVSVTSGSASGAISLSTGTNTITTVVTAQDASTKTYTITVTFSAPATPTIVSSTPTLTGQTTNYGTAATAGTFNVSGTNMGAGILVTPPAGFEVSTDNTTFTSTVTVGAAGTITSTPVYVRLAAATIAGTYSGNVQLTSSGATEVDVAIASSTVSAILPTITDLPISSVSTTAATMNATVTDGGAATTVTFLVSTVQATVAGGGGSVQTGSGNGLSITAGSGSTSSNFTDVVLSSGTTYYYQVHASNAASVLAGSDVVGAVGSFTALPSAPVPSIAGNSATVVSFDWLTVAGAISYTYDVATDNSFTSIVPGYSNVSTTSTAVSITGLTGGTQYYFRVKALVTGGAAGAYSSTLGFITPASPNFTANYDFNQANGTSPDLTPVPVTEHVTHGSFTVSGATATNASGRFNANTWGTGTTINTSNYFSVTLTPASGYNLSLSALGFTVQRSATGPAKYSVRSSVDNFAADLPGTITSNVNLTQSSGVFTNSNTSAAQAGTNITIGSSFTNLTGPVTFRIYGFNASSTGTFSVDNVKFTGTTAQLPTVTTTTPATNITGTTVTLSGNVTSAGGSSLTDEGIIYSNSANPTISTGTQVSAGTTTVGAFSSSVTGLTGGTLYHYVAYATSSIGTSYGADQTFTTSSNVLDKVGLTSATPAAVAYSLRLINSNYTGPLARITIGSNYYDVYPDATTDKAFSLTSPISAAYVTYNAASTGATATALSAVVTGSTTATVAIWYDQSGNGTDLAQATSINQPRIINAGAIDTENGKPFIRFFTTNGYNSLNLPAQITTTGQLIAVNKFGAGGDGFILGNTGDYKWHSSPPKLFDSGNGSASVTNSTVFQNGTSIAPTSAVWNTILGVNSVAPQTPAANTLWDNIGSDRNAFHNTSLGGGYAELFVFAAALSTANRQAVESTEFIYYAIGPPTLTTTTPATNITATTATLAGNVSADNGNAVTEKGIVYSTSVNPTTSDTKATNGAGTGAISVSITGLTANSTYHYRAYAINSQGTAYGADQTFTTLALPVITSFTSTAGSSNGNDVINQPVAGGATITITGTNFLAGMTISTGETVTVVSATSATYTLAAGTAGNSVLPTVTVGGVTSVASASISYLGSKTLDLAGLTSADPGKPSYSLRKLSSSYVGKAINIRRSSDNATLDIGFTAAGHLDTAAAKTFVGSGTGYVTKWYDQSGNYKDASQATTSLQPVIIVSGVVQRKNSRPTIYFNGTYLLTASFSGPYTAGFTFAVVGGVNANTTYSTFLGKASGYYAHPIDEYNTNMFVGSGTAGTYVLYQMPTAISAATGFAQWTFSSSTTQSNNYNNGNANGSNAITNYADGNNVLGIATRGDLATSLNGWISEIVSAGTMLTSTPRQAVESSQRTYYVTPQPAATITSFTSTAGVSSGNNIINQPVAGGSTVTITGTNFTSPITISTGEAVTLVSSTSATYTLAAHAAGTITPTVTFGGVTVGTVPSISYGPNTLDLAGLTSTTPATVAYSVRKVSSAYPGSAINVRRSSDNTTMDIGFNAAKTLDTAALKTFVGSGNGFVTKFYDQSGNARDLVQATTSKQPAIVNAGVVYRRNNLPSIYFDATDDNLTYGGSNYMTTVPLSVNLVAGSNSSGTGFRRAIIGTGGANWLIGPYGNADSWFAGAFNLQSSGNPWSLTNVQSFTVTETAGAVAEWRNGASQTLASNSNGVPNTLALGGALSPYNEPLDGYVSEMFGFAGTALSTADRTALEGNQLTTYPAVPIIASITATTGTTSGNNVINLPVAGGGTVTLTGTNFATGMTISTGETVTVVSGTSATYTVAAKTAGTVLTPTVTTTGGTSAAGPTLTYASLPTLTSITATTGTTSGNNVINLPVAGGGTVTLTGTNFLTGMTISTGEIVTVVSGTSATYTVAAKTAGTVLTPTVTTTGGTSVAGPTLTYASGPTVTTTTPATSITATSATLAGAVSADGGASVTEKGIVYGTSVNPTIADTKVINGTATGTGAISVSITGLTTNTTYHYRAYAINSIGTSYGADQTVTPVGAPTVTSFTASVGIARNNGIINLPATGGSTITITGTNFLPGMTVSTGETATVISLTSATYTLGAQVSGTNVTPTVTTSSGTSAAGPSLIYTSNDPGTALVFNGSSQKVSVNTTLGNFGTGAFTIEAWIKTTATGQGYIASKRNVGSQGNFWELGIQSGKVTFEVDATNASDFTSLASTASVNDGKWHHIVGVKSSTQGIIYIDGVLDFATPLVGNPNINNVANIYIGGADYSSFSYTGSIDEVRIYNKALTQLEVQSDMLNLTSASPANLQAYYNFNEGTGTALTDVGGTNIGTLVNSPTWAESYAMVVPTLTPATSVTTTSFVANWTAPVVGAVTNYLLDVSTSATFSSAISGSPFTIASPTLTKAVSSLTPGTVYYYRVRADKTSVTGQGDYSAIQIIGGALPTVTTTSPATAITGSTAVLAGNVSADGGAFVTAKGIVYATNSNPTLATGTVLTNSTGTGTISMTATGLTPLTLYHYVAYATNGVGTVYGADQTFTTLTLPVITSFASTTGSASGVNIIDQPVPGGSTITITGTNFLTGMTISTGETVTVNSATSATYTLAAGTASATITPTVTTVNGTSAPSAQITYLPGPSIISFASTAGVSSGVNVLLQPAAGGSTITITGTNFLTGMTISTGETVTVNSSTSASYTLAAGIQGRTIYPIVTTANGGSSAPSATITYSYTPPGNALNFISNSVDFGNAATLAAPNIKTMEAWVKLNNITNNMEILSKSLTNSGIELSTLSGNLCGYFMNDASNTSHIDYPLSGNIQTGKWYHFALTWDGLTKESIKLYVNGISVGTRTDVGNINTAPGVITDLSPFFRIGNWNDAPARFFAGNIDEVSIWSTNRSAANIQADMLNVQSVPTTGLVAYYNFDAGTAGGTNTGLTTLADQTGNANTGTLKAFGLTGATRNWVESYAMVVPTATTASNIGIASIDANWTAPALGTVNNYLLDVSASSTFGSGISGSPFTVASPAVTKTITGLASNTTYYYRIRADKTGVAGQGAYSNTITATTLGPLITASGTLTTLSTTYGTASSETSFSASGVRLTADITVTAPTGFEVSTTSGTGYGTTTTLTQTSGSASGTVYVRLAATTAVGSAYSGNVVLTSSGAAAVNIATVTSSVTAAPLTITANQVSKPYGNTLSTATGSTAFTPTGLKNSETVGSVTLTYGTGAAAAAPVATNAGTAVPSLAVGGTFTASNYSITYAGGDIVVTQLALTVTATGPAKAYGTALAAATSSINFTVTGTPATGQALTSVTLTPDADGLSATTAAGATYVVTPSAATGTGGFLASNYNITYSPFNGTVGQIALTVTATGPSKLYGTALSSGTSNTNFTVTGTPVSGEALTGVTLTPDAAGISTATAAGSAYVVTPSLATGTGGFTASNYNITYVPFNGTVGQIALTVTATGPSKTYGTALTAGTSATNFTVTGTPLSGEALTGVTLTPDANGQNGALAAGSSYTVTPSLATGTGGFVASNYNITYTPFSGTVSAAALTVTATGPSKTYGTALATATSGANFTVTGTLGSGQALTGVTLTPDAAGTSTTTAAGASYAVTPSLATGTGGFLASNYNITYTPFSGTVAKANLTITANTATKTYGQTLTTASGLTAFSSSGLKNSESIGSVTLTYGTGSAPTANVGTYPNQVTPSLPAGGTFTAANYNITFASGSISVGTANLTIEANGVSKVPGNTLVNYSGSAAFTATGLQNGESAGTFTITYGAGASAADAPGTYTNQVSASALTGGTITASNYSISYVNGNIVIGTSTITVNVAGGALQALSTTFGSASVTTTFTVSGSNLANDITITPPTGFEVASSSGGPFGNTVILTESGGGVGTTNVYVRLKATTAVGSSYNGNVVASSGGAVSQNIATTTSTVNAAALTITASNATKAYGTAITGGTGSTAYTITGGSLKNGNTISSVTVAYGTGALATAGVNTYTGSVTPSAAVGANGFLTSNYSITYAVGNIIVNPIALTVAATGPAKTYGTALTTGTSSTNFTVTGTPASGEAVTGVTLTPDANGLAAGTVAGASYVVTPSAATGTGGFLASNYSITYTPFSGTVAAAALTVAATGPAKPYGTALITGLSTTDFTVTGTLASGQALTSVTLTPDAAGLSAATAAGTSYVVTPSAATGTGGFVASNYNITYTPFNGTVAKLALTIAANGPSKTYGTALTAGASTTYFTVTGTTASGEALTSVTLTPDAAGLSATTAAGTGYVVTPSAATGTGGFSANNYNITYTPYNGTVSAVALTVAATGPSKTYGTALTAGASSTNFTVTGTPASGEALTSVTLTPDATGLSATTAAGASYAVTPSAATGTGGFLASNYSITYTPFNGTVSAAALTVTATDPSKVYGTALAAGTSTTGFTVTGTLASGQAVTGVTLTPDAAGLASTTAAGASYSVTPSAATGTGGFVASNYSITYTPFSGTVTKAALSITASTANKTYGQTLTGGAGSTAFTSSGLQNSESIGTVTIAYGTGAAATAAVNTYTGSVTPSSAIGGSFTASNYTITYNTGNIVVGTATLNITANDVPKVPGNTLTNYSGSAAFVATGLQNSESAGTVSIAYGTGSAAGDPPGTYANQVVPSALTGGSISASNYNITYVSGAIVIGTSTINTSGTLTAMSTTFGTASANKAFTISASNLSNNLVVTPPSGFEVSTSSGSGFGGTVTLTPSGGIVNGTTIFIRLAATTGAGTYSGNVVVSSTGAASKNVATVNSTVSAYALTVTAGNATKTYGTAITGSTGSTAYNITSGTLQNSNTISSLTVAYGTGALATAGVNTYAGSVTPSAAVGANGFLTSNYNITYAAGDIIVNQATLTVTATGVNKIYDGNNTATVTLSDNRVNSDVFTTTYAATFNNKNVGTGKAVSVTAIAISGGASANYTLAGTTASATGNITVATATVTAQTDTKVYNRSTASAVVPVVTGLLGTDVVGTAPTQTFDTRNVGTAKTLTPVGLVITDGNSGGNYTISYVNNTTGIITTAAATVTAQTDTKTYNKTATSSVAPIVTGLVSGDVVATAPTQTYNNANVGTAKNMTATGLVINDGNSGANYAISYVANATGVISTATATVTAQADTKTYDRTAVSAVVPVVTGLISGDVIATQPTQTYNNANVGTGKTMTATGLTITDGNSGGNYTISYVANTAGVITTKAAIVTAQADAKTYDKTNTSAVVPIVTGLISGDAIATQPTQTYNNANVGTGKTMTAAGLVITDGNSGGNYTISYVANTAGVITSKAATVTAQADTKSYDRSALSSVVPVVTGLVSGDVIATQPTQTYNNANVGTGKTMTATGLAINDGNGGGNYSISYVTNTAGVITGLTATVTAQADTKTYNRSAASSVAPVVTGLSAGDVIATAPIQTYNNANAGTGKTMTASGLVINDGNGGANYTITYVANTAGVINKATATVTAQTSNKVYDRTTSSAVVPVVTGLLTGDVIATQPTQTYNNVNAGTGKTLTPAGLVINDGNNGANYSINYVNNNTGVIQTLGITVQTLTSARRYDKTTSSTTVPLVQGLVTGDVIATAPIETYDDANAGTGKTLTSSGLVINDGNNGNNYSILYTSIVGGIIIKAPATVTAQADTKGYDRTTTSTVAPVVTGLVTGDVAATVPTQTYDNANAGTGKTMTAAGLTINDGNGGANYSIVYVTNTTGVITKLTATVTAQADTKVYDKTIGSGVVPVVTGLLAGDVVGTAPKQVFINTIVGTGKTLTPSGLVVNDGNGGANYAITYVPNLTGVITAKVATVTAQANTKVYDKTLASATAPVVTGLVGGDVIAIAPTQTYNNANTGTGKTMTATGLVINDGNSGNNYAISYITNSAGVITTAAATVTAQANTKVYDKTLASATAPVVTGLVGGDVIATAPTQVYNNANAGTGKTMTATGLVINDGNSGNNYAISYVTNNAGVITTKAATVTAQTDTKVYNTTAASAGVPVVTGLVGGDVIATAPTQTYNNANVGTGKTMTAAGLVINDGNGGNNYSVGYVTNTTGVITPVTLTYTATPASRVYGAANPTFAGTVTGFVSPDTQTSATTGTAVFATAATSASVVGSYAITGSGLTSANYVFAQASANGTALTITAAPLNIAAANQTKVYGTANPTLTANYTGFVNGDNAASLTTQPAFATTATVASPVNTYPITVSGAASANYTINYTTGTLAVTPAPLTITAVNQSRVINTPNPTLTATYNGFVNGDSNTSLATQPIISTTAVTASQVGNYPITVTGASSPNYAITYVAGTLTVTASSNANLANIALSSGTLNPIFAQGTLTYTAAVANTVTAITLTPTTADVTATVKVNGVTVASGASSQSIPLTVGTNTITTVVTAQNGTTVVTYTTTVTRAPSSVASLANLTISSGTLTPAFNPATYNYTALVDNTISQVTLTPTLTDATATILINGQPATNAQGTTINLLVGDNNISVFTTAQDGTTKLTYTLVIHRATAPLAIQPNNILSPDGDGRNDTWIVKDIQSYPNNIVTVYDRAGRTVYTKRTYNNDWNGTFQGSPLAEGTYYYVIDLGTGVDAAIKGFVTIVRRR